MTTVVVGGAVANKPGNGGEAWVRLSWLDGLRRLGVDAYLVEEIDPAAATDGEGHPTAVADSWNLAYFGDVVDAFGMAERAALIDVGTGAVHGMAGDRLADLADAADLLVNISGHLRRSPVFERFGRRAYVDIDPGYTQIWHVQGATGLGLARHHLHFSIAANLGRPGCAIPTGGFEWLPVTQPVVLDAWPVAAVPGGALDRFTTVASWRGAFGSLEHDGHRYGLKAHEFRKVLGLPHGGGSSFELALAIHSADDVDRRRLQSHGWTLVDPAVVAGTPSAFRDYVQASPAEFSVAQGVYVDTNSGWFSDRSVRYLASGRPVVVQDTGFGSWLPAGEGVVPFRTLAEARAAVARVAADYSGHSQAARAIAERHFASDVVLPRFLDMAGVS